MINKILKRIISWHVEMETIRLQLWMITDKEMSDKLLVQLKEECRSTGNSPEYVFQRYRNQIVRGISPLVRPKD